MGLFGDHIKHEFIDKTRVNSNLQEWEKTFLKTFSRHKNIFLKNKALFCLNSCVTSNMMKTDNETTHAGELALDDDIIN